MSNARSDTRSGAGDHAAPSDVVDVAQASALLGLSTLEVRSLVADRTLPAFRERGRWLLPRAAVSDYAHQLAEITREPPYGPEIAWGLLLAAAGAPTPWLDEPQRRVVARRLREPMGGWLPRVAGRAEVRPLYSFYPSEAERLLGDPAVVVTGATVAARRGLLPRRGQVEVYVRAEDVESLTHRYRMAPAREPNILIRVPARVWPFSGERHVAPDPVVIADLLESEDPQDRDAGHTLLTRATTPGAAPRGA